MSRSYKKPWLKDPANSYMKRIHARRFRRMVHQTVKQFRYDPLWDYCGEGMEWKCETPMDINIPHYRSVTNQYDICDYIFWGSDPKDKRK